MNFSHLNDVEESYFSHMALSLKLCFMFTVLAYVALIHSILPFVMTNVVSKKIENIQNAISIRN